MNSIVAVFLALIISFSSSAFIDLESENSLPSRNSSFELEDPMDYVASFLVERVQNEPEETEYVSRSQMINQETAKYYGTWSLSGMKINGKISTARQADMKSLLYIGDDWDLRFYNYSGFNSNKYTTSDGSFIYLYDSASVVINHKVYYCFLTSDSQLTLQSKSNSYYYVKVADNSSPYSENRVHFRDGVPLREFQGDWEAKFIRYSPYGEFKPIACFRPEIYMSISTKSVMFDGYIAPRDDSIFDCDFDETGLRYRDKENGRFYLDNDLPNGIPELHIWRFDISPLTCGDLLVSFYIGHCRYPEQIIFTRCNK